MFLNPPHYIGGLPRRCTLYAAMSYSVRSHPFRVFFLHRYQVFTKKYTEFMYIYCMILDACEYFFRSEAGHVHYLCSIITTIQLHIKEHT